MNCFQINRCDKMCTSMFKAFNQNITFIQSGSARYEAFNLWLWNCSVLFLTNPAFCLMIGGRSSVTSMIGLMLHYMWCWANQIPFLSQRAKWRMKVKTKRQCFSQNWLRMEAKFSLSQTRHLMLLPHRATYIKNIQNIQRLGFTNMTDNQKFTPV